MVSKPVKDKAPLQYLPLTIALIVLVISPLGISAATVVASFSNDLVGGQAADKRMGFHLPEGMGRSGMNLYLNFLGNSDFENDGDWFETRDSSKWGGDIAGLDFSYDTSTFFDGTQSLKITATQQGSLPGGYVITGNTESFGVGNQNVWLLKTDDNGITCDYSGDGNCNGNDVFVRRYSESPNWAYEGQPTDDGGYVLCGKRWGDFWLLKTDETGDVQMEDPMIGRTYGGPDAQYGRGIQTTQDGGNIIIAQGYSGGWMIKTDADGDTCTHDANGNCDGSAGGIPVFARSFGPAFGYYSVQPASDGGYVISASYSGDYWLIKTDEHGDTCDFSADGNCDGTIGGKTVFAKRFVISGRDLDLQDFAQSVSQTSDGGYIIVGHTNGFNPAGVSDMMVIKTDEHGESCQIAGCNNDNTFVRVLGGQYSHVYGYSGWQAPNDDGFVILGFSSGYNQFSGMWLIKVDGNGDICDWSGDGECTGTGVFAKIFEDGFADSMWPTVDQSGQPDGYIIAGQTSGFGIPYNEGWLVKTDLDGNTCDYSGDGECDESSVFVKRFVSTSLKDVKQTDDGKYIIGASMGEMGNGLIKVDANGNTCDYSDGNCVDEPSGTFVKGFAGPGAGSVESVDQSLDGGYVLVGDFWDSELGGFPDAWEVWFVKTDQYGDVQPPTTECTRDIDCDDGNACTINRCINSNCVFLNCDIDGNHNVGLSDIMRIISAWATNQGDPGYVPEYDIDGNGNIGLGDVMIVISLWANNC